jgi:ABC-2 type transport system ATP-binding protein
VAVLLERITGASIRVDRAGRRVTAPATGGAPQLATMIGRLDDAAVPIDEIGLRRPTLDEVFTIVTETAPAPREPYRSNR